MIARHASTAISISSLPLTLMRLDDWAVSGISGADSGKYLQGQLTADVLKLGEDQHVMAAHCDPKGKMWGVLHLFARGEGFGWIERRTVQPVQLAELKKYAVFAKVSLSADERAVLLGLAGEHAREALAACFPALAQGHLPDAAKPFAQCAAGSVLWFPWPQERFLIVTDEQKAQQIIHELGEQAQIRDSNQWLALDIAAGYPVIDAVSSGQFLPQACNLQVFGGISFKKGCYSGQEMVSRAKFRGANKRALYCLQGSASRLALAGEDLQLNLGDNWRRTGSVLAAVALADGSLLVQAVLNNDLPASSLLRVRDCASGALRIAPLPYPLDEG